MPKTKKMLAVKSAAPSSAAFNGAVSEIVTLAEAAAYLRLSEADIVNLVQAQNLPGRFTGSEWRFLKSAIQQWLAIGSPSDARKEGRSLAWRENTATTLTSDANLGGEAYCQRGVPPDRGRVGCTCLDTDTLWDCESRTGATEHSDLVAAISRGRERAEAAGRLTFRTKPDIACRGQLKHSLGI